MIKASYSEKLYLAVEQFRLQKEMTFIPISQGEENYYFIAEGKRTCYIDFSMIALFRERVKTALPCAMIVEECIGVNRVFKIIGEATGIRNLRNTSIQTLSKAAFEVLMADGELLIYENIPRLQKIKPTPIVTPPYQGIGKYWFYDLQGNVCNWDKKIDKVLIAQEVYSKEKCFVTMDPISGVALEAHGKKEAVSNLSYIVESGFRFSLRHQCLHSTLSDDAG